MNSKVWVESIFPVRARYNHPLILTLIGGSDNLLLPNLLVPLYFQD